MEGKRPHDRRRAFFNGFIITLAAAVLVPVLADVLLTPLLEDLLIERSFLIFSGPILVTLVLWSIVLLLKTRLSGGQIMRRFGVSGVLGLIVAYWYLGNPWGAVIPVLSIILVLLLTNRRRVSEWFKN